MNKMASKYPSQPLEKIRALYKSTQTEVANGQLNRITSDRMNKRYGYIAKQVQKKQQMNDKENIEEMIFYRNKFHSLVVLVGDSMRESYNKNKFETEVKNILKDDWETGKGVMGGAVGKNTTNQVKKITSPQQQQDTTSPQQHQNTYKVTSSEYITQPIIKQAITKPEQKSPISKQRSHKKNRSLSPLQQFFQSKEQEIKKTKHIMNFQSVVPKSQLTNSKLLGDIKQMNKKSINRSTFRNRTPEKTNHEDSRLRDLKRENEELQRIFRKRQHEGSGETIQNLDQLEKQLNYFNKLNYQLRQQAGNIPDPNLQYHRDESPYSISYRQNNVNEISYRNLHNETSRKAMQKLTSKSPQNRSQTFITNNSKVNDSKSNRTNTSSIVQKEKELYINSTPQILFENELIKVLVVRFPLRIHEKNVSSNEKLNPEEQSPNEERLEIMILNNANKYVKNQELYIKLGYDYDTKHHQIQSFKKPHQGYSKVAQTSQDIVYREIVKVKLLSRQGYNEEIKAMVKAEFTYNPDVKKKRIFNESLKDKRTDNFSIEFSSKPFSSRDLINRKTKLTIKPNPLYDTVEHAYMNTNLPFLKSSNPRVLKEHATLFGRSFIHDSHGKGTYLESEIDLAWFQKKDVRYISVQTIEEWVYLLAYIFLDVEEEEEEFDKEFRKPSMHVFFNLENKQYV